MRSATFVAGAEALHGARAAARLARRAPGGAKIHDRLVEVVAATPRHQCGGEVPERSLTAHARQPPGPHEDAAEDTPHVGVEHGGVPAVRERKDRARGVAPDPRQGSQRLLAVGETAAVAGDGLPRDRVEANRTDVVAEWVPEAPYGVDGRCGEALDGRVVAQELAILRHDPVDLRLLEHDLRDEHAVRLERGALGLVAVVLGVLREQSSLNTLYRRARWQSSGAKSSRIVFMYNDAMAYSDEWASARRQVGLLDRRDFGVLEL